MPKFTDATPKEDEIKCFGCSCCKGENIDERKWCVECYANYGKPGNGSGTTCVNIKECGWPYV